MEVTGGQRRSVEDRAGDRRASSCVSLLYLSICVCVRASVCGDHEDREDRGEACVPRVEHEGADWCGSLRSLGQQVWPRLTAS